MHLLQRLDPPPSPATMATELAKTIKDTCGEDAQKIIDWLSAEGVKSCEDFGLLATEEKEVATLIFPAANAAGIKTDKILTQIQFKKLWSACRKASIGSNSSGVNEEGESNTPLDEKTRKSCEALWVENHGYSLSAGRRLVLTQMHVMHVMSHAQHRDFSLLPIRRMRLQDGSLNDSKEDTTHVCFLKLRAYFYSMAFVCQDMPGFFNLQAAENTVDKILIFLHTRHPSRPPPNFHSQAWESTARTFQSAVRAGRSLNDAVAAESTYQHFWTIYVPEVSGLSGGGHSGSGSRGTRGGRRGQGQDGGKSSGPQHDQSDALARLQRTKDLEIARLTKQLKEATSGPQQKRQKWSGKW